MSICVSSADVCNGHTAVYSVFKSKTVYVTWTGDETKLHVSNVAACVCVPFTGLEGGLQHLGMASPTHTSLKNVPESWSPKRFRDTWA